MKRIIATLAVLGSLFGAGAVTAAAASAAPVAVAPATHFYV